ncbi:methylated-DNA--protein-cysteine methyltransferase [Longispora fulva]|uniref:Methylated-DNA--protein-cysteine methyltransferase n=1 Tax=Longispora fulva TaxID=619741 RepID=A0A8J7GKI3_9ACTN|nr:methylated-DNA--[protein]-cysteine S-methyltransferase [Longispora fulva]MBG6138517.1 methylated-DNA-[protein]-cysteine S-methyltransferase [Longispora fulva]GIG62378.1 methylated-DNA--protein-cysteine methyltransferase [Longispora fulva]
MEWALIPAPFGPLAVAADEHGVCRIQFEGVPGPLGDSPYLDSLREQMAAYFAGELTEFDVPLSVRVGSPFERRVWAALREIPYGEMATYGRIATDLGDSGAARAVGTANNHNPLPIVVPCHRVVGADGKLVGFGGGLHRKKHLLELEARVRVEREFGL